MLASGGLRGIAILLSLLGGIIISCSPAEMEQDRPAAGVGHRTKNYSDSSVTRLFLDFEDGGVEKWHPRNPNLVSKRGLSMEVVPATQYNRSGKVLHFSTQEGSGAGGARFILEENGVEPIPLTQDTHLAWAWNVSRDEDMNGVWITLNILDNRTGRDFMFRAVNHIRYMHDCVVTHDPARCWCYHSEPVYDFIWRRWGPFGKGDLIIESIGLAMARAEGVEAWIDNIWVGHGEPPDYVNNISDSSKVDVDKESRMTGFSYAYINHDNIPDRVEAYRERADIFINPHRSEHSADLGTVRNVRIEPDIILEFREQRWDAVVTPADLDGDGHPDLLFQFDDLKGNICYRNDYLKGSFREVAVGALLCPGEHGSGTAVGDMDGDTDLDVFMFNGFRKRGGFGGVRMFRNEGDFNFTDWTKESYLNSMGSFGGIFADFNNDGYRDLFISYKPMRWGGSNRPFINFNDGTGRFAPSLDAMKDPVGVHFNICSAADFDNDGDLDIYCISDFKFNFPDSLSPSMMFRNDGDGTFTDITESSGAGYLGQSSGLVTGDFNLDGLVDIYVVNIEDRRSALYLNRGKMKFRRTERFTSLMCKEMVRALVALDFDLDGDLDLVMLTARDSRLLIRENTGNPDNFIQVRLRGKGANRSGLGGKVYLYEAGHLNQQEHLLGYREVTLDGCRETKSVPVAHFGLGRKERADLKVVFPPSGDEPPAVLTRENVRKGSFITVCQQEGVLDRILCTHRADHLRDSLVFHLFRIPLWLLASLIFLAVVSSGVWIRDSVETGTNRIGRKAVFVLTVALSLLLIYRSTTAGLLLLITAGLIVIFSYRLEGVFRGLYISSARREKMEEILFDDLSQAIHTEKKFAFLSDIARTDSEMEKDQIEDDFRSLDKMVSVMRMISPADHDWRIIRKEIGKIRKMAEHLIREGPEKISTRAERRVFRNTLDRLNSMLEDYRIKLRKKYSVNFLDEWEELKEEYRQKLIEKRVELLENFPDDISERSVHLLPEEFRHIFKNMFDNSIYAVEKVPVRIIDVEARYEVDFLVLRWQDTGPGLPRGIEEEIFVSPVRSDRPGGMGEGSYQSGKIMNRRGGRIRPDRTPDSTGASFVIKLVVF